MKVDFLTLVPDGEPTLDINLIHLLSELKQFGIPLAVITNASLINLLDVQEALMLADWISLKIDAVEEATWRKINRPHHQLSLNVILKGIREFRWKYSGELVTETMLVSGVNDSNYSINLLIDFLVTLVPFKSFFSIPVRPPAEGWVKLPDSRVIEDLLRRAIQDYPFFDFLIDAEVGDFSSTGELASDILGITLVHPMREVALKEMVSHAQGDWSVVESLLDSNQLEVVEYRGERFFLSHDPMKFLIRR
jgi:wyosine [tRNA(Phe)-imidazoG37] synthetase (radical SAM superfamily)